MTDLKTPCLLRTIRIPSWRRPEITQSPDALVWGPNDAEEDAPDRDWLDANTPGWSWHIQVAHDSGNMAETRDDDWDIIELDILLDFSTASHRTAYLQWVADQRKAWQERYAMVAPDAPFCEKCGGTVRAARCVKDLRFFDVSLSVTYDGHWCDHCNSSRGIAIPVGHPSGRIFELDRIVRRHFGISHGKAPVEPIVRHVLEVDASISDEEFKAMLATIPHASV